MISFIVPGLPDEEYLYSSLDSIYNEIFKENFLHFFLRLLLLFLKKHENLSHSLLKIEKSFI